MTAIGSLISAHTRGDRGSLEALGVALAAVLRPAPDLPDDPGELWDAVETQVAPVAGTWQEVRAARDHGDLTDAEYDYLSAAVDALTQEAGE